MWIRLPLKTLSGSGEAFAFFNVTDATRLPDGSLMVLDGGSFEVRHSDPSGRHLWSFGREGEGPGELVASPALIG